ncbi:hypothetical protein Tco_0055348, partial [Tanacetum coccineum]
RTKHIDIRYHWIRDAIEDGMFELNKVYMDDNASDMLTKAVAREKLKERHNKPLKTHLKEMIVVHLDVEFLDDITGRLKEASRDQSKI